MTSDAKVGLLLGLLFIFIIAFLINGLPSLRGDRDSNELTSIMTGSGDSRLGISNRQLTMINHGQGATGASRRQGAESTFSYETEQQNDVVRSRLPLDTIAEAVENAGYEPAVPQPHTGQPTAPEPARDDVPAKPAGPLLYTVRAGDNLSVIAKKFYGDQEGNRIRNINRIFRANRGTLNSPDNVRQGQQLIIPPLSGAPAAGTGPAGIFDGRLFEQVQSIGAARFSRNQAQRLQLQQYTVRAGDNLWKIAAETLGDGNRYKEIVKLNSDALDNEHRIVVGMRLRLPAK